MFEKGSEDNDHYLNPSGFDRGGYEDTVSVKEWSKGRKLIFFVAATLTIIGVSYIIARFYVWMEMDLYGYAYYYRTIPIEALFTSFLLIMMPLGYSTYGLLYLRSKYGRFIGNAKTYVVRALLVISGFVLILHIFNFRWYYGTFELVFFPFFIIFLFSIFGLPIAFAVGWWRERSKIHKRFKRSDSRFLKISKIAHRLGINEGSAYKQINRLLSRNGMRGYITKDKDHLVKDSLKNEVISYLRKNSGRGELPLRNIENEFQIPEYVAISVIKKLMDDRGLGGRIDPIKSVYRYE